ncbi:MAG TPA: prolyl oligopeptidase family serine peptidase [Opitutaceae bacterium]|nr:prolyl oligopeptidase family serine peptidase [Opitutaceae bacterium]
MRRFLALGCAAMLAASGGWARAQTPPSLPEDAAWRTQRDALVERFRNLAGHEDEFGPAWQPIYRDARPWYELWGGQSRHEVDSWMMPPDAYGAELAGDWEHHRNLFAEDPRANIPLVFTTRLSDGTVMSTNYWLDLPTGFPAAGRRWPLIVGLHGSGWLGHPISFVAGRRDAKGPVRTFSVTPIDMKGPWKIEFLNKFLDHLLAILPVDPDRVYAEGHSLGGMATWIWAEDNPERFAAISPRAGIGEMYRAVRLMHVPAWPIHGAEDPVVPRLFDEQMVSALQNLGAPVRYTVLAGVQHNMPADLDEEQVIDWYLRQTRYHGPAPADPRDGLQIGPDGSSPWTVVHARARRYFVSRNFRNADWDGERAVVGELGEMIHAAGLTADAELEEVVSLATGDGRFRMPVPSNLRTDTPPPAASRLVPAQTYVRFVFRGPRAEGLKHLRQVADEAKAAGHPSAAAGEAVIVPLTIWRDNPDSLAEYRIPVEGL